MSLGKRQSTDDEPAESASSEINLQTALDSSPWETLDIVGERRDNSCEECLSLYKGWVGKQYFLPYCSETLSLWTFHPIRPIYELPTDSD